MAAERQQNFGPESTGISFVQVGARDAPLVNGIQGSTGNTGAERTNTGSTHASAGGAGAAIEQMRKQASLSQEDLGALCQLRATHISSMERGGRNLTYATLVRLAAALGTTVGELTALADELYDQLPAAKK